MQRTVTFKNPFAVTTHPGPDHGWGPLRRLRRRLFGQTCGVESAHATWTTARHLTRMLDRGSLALITRDGGGTAIGFWPDAHDHGRVIGSPHGASTLCLAPEGRAEARRVVVKAILCAEDASVVVNDVGGEILAACGPARGDMSHLIVMDWGATDAVPEMPLRLGDGRTALDDDGNAILVPDYDSATFHPRFNALSPAFLPPEGEERERYLGRIVGVLIPGREGREADVDAPRAVLCDLIHAMVRMNGDPRNQAVLPEAWLERENSFPMLADWLAEGERRDAEAADGGRWLGALVDRLRSPGARREGRDATRAFDGLSMLLESGPAERARVVDAVGRALSPFERPAVKQRTSTSDFTPADVRATRDQHGIWKPTSLFVSTSRADAPAYAGLTAMLVEAITHQLVERNHHVGDDPRTRELSRNPVHFVLDGFVDLPRMDGILGGIDLGRSMKIDYLLVAPSAARIRGAHGRDFLRSIESLVAVTVVPPQDDPETIRVVIDRVGMTVNPTSGTEERFLDEADLVAPVNGDLLVIVRGNPHRPVRLWNLRGRDAVSGGGQLPSRRVPRVVHDRRVAEHREAWTATLLRERARSRRIAGATGR